MRNKYGREQRKWKITKKSGAEAREFKHPYILDSLGWLKPYFIERETPSNWETNRDETLAQEDDGEEQEEGDHNVSVAPVESNKSVAVTNPKTPANSPNSGGKKEFLLSHADHNSQKEMKRKLNRRRGLIQW